MSSVLPFTVWANAALVLPLKPGAVLVPLYSAVMLCGLPATERLDVVQVAVLPLRATALHRVVAPSLKVTVPIPLGLPAADVTVAVKVREAPNALGLVPVVRARAVEVVLRAKKLLLAEDPPAAITMPLMGLVPM